MRTCQAQNMTSKLRTMSNYLIRTRIISIIFFLYLVVAVLVVPYEGEKLAYSVFYQSSPVTDRDRNLLENAARVREAELTLRELRQGGKKFLHLSTPASPRPEFCFAIVSVSRPASVHYLTQVVGRLLPQIIGSGAVFAVFNAEGPTHKEAMNLSSFVPVVTQEGGGEGGGGGGKSPANIRRSFNKFAKEKRDYTNALEWCQKKQTEFSVIMQDDALPPTDFLQRLRFVLEHRAPRDHGSWAFLKLYYPEKWEGWGNEWWIVLELVASSVAIGVVFTVFTYIFQVVIARSLPSASEAFSPTSVLLRLVLSFCLAIYMLLTLGRPHWLALRGLTPHLSSVVSAPGCCIPAVVYPQEHLPDIIQYLRTSRSPGGLAVDLELDNFADQKGLERLLVVPNLVRHIGFVSTLGKGWKNPREFRIR